MAKVLIAPSPLDGIEVEFVKVLKDAGHELVYPKKGEQLSESELIHWLNGVPLFLLALNLTTKK